jgi:hypothetical protein
MTKQVPKQKQRAGASSCSPPVSFDEAPGSAVQTGRSPEPDNKHAKRSATKRRLTKKAVDDR